MTELAGYTPGPLMIRGLSGEQIPHCTACACVSTTESGYYLTKLCPLHAAAPALLAALRSLVAWADAGCPFHAPDESVFPAARAAIRQAEGA